MANKGRVLYLPQYFQGCSDEDLPMTTAEIRKLVTMARSAHAEELQAKCFICRVCQSDKFAIVMLYPVNP